MPNSHEIVNLSLDLLDDFPNHTFATSVDTARCNYESLVDSINLIGVVMPIIVRPKDNGRYEIVAGHRRVTAARAIKLQTIPAIIRDDLDDDWAAVVMVDTNTTGRDSLLPSEIAKAFALKAAALQRRRGRPPKKEQEESIVEKENITDINGLDTAVENNTADGDDGKSITDSVKDEPDLSNKHNRTTAALIGRAMGCNTSQVERFLKLNNLIPELMQRVDDNEISLSAAAVIAGLPQDKQEAVNAASPTGKQILVTRAREILKQKDMDSPDEFYRYAKEALNPEKKVEVKSVRINKDLLQECFPGALSDQKLNEEMESLVGAIVDIRNLHLEKLGLTEDCSCGNIITQIIRMLDGVYS